MGKIDIAKFKRQSKKKKPVLAKFLRKLGKSTTKGILKKAKEAETAAWKEVQCLDCGNCCKQMTPTFTRKDILRISKHFNLTYQEFFDKYLEKRRDGDITNRKEPCQFLGKDNKCSIYEIRPDDCAGFPHLYRRDIRYQAQEKTYTQNLDYCPATLLFVEKLQASIEADL